MLRQINKKVWCRFISLVVIGVFIFSSIANAGIVSVYDLRTKAAKKTDAPLGLGRDLSSFGMKPNVNILLRGSTRFKTGFELVNPKSVIDDFDTEASVMTAVNLTLKGLRGAVLGLDKKKDSDRISAIKVAADGVAKGIYQRIVKEDNLILVVRVSEGMGRDEVIESFMANEVVVPDELLGELKDISKAIEAGSVKYVSKTGKVYRIKNAIIDVIEGTNAFVSNVGGKELKDLRNSESGATSAIVMSDGRLLGNCPDIYANGIFTLVPRDKRQGFIDEPLDPELTASDSSKIESVLLRIAEANGIRIGDLEVVLMERAREAQGLAVLKELQKKYPGLEITTISDGTMAHSLLATFGRREGKHKIVMTVGGAPEVFLDIAVASLFKNEGALASARLYSKNVNKTADGKDAQNLSRRYAFDSKEREELNSLRPDDAEAIISGNKLFTQEDVQGDVEGSFSFITNNGVFNIKGAEKVAEDKIKVSVLRVDRINGKPAVWISEKVIDPNKGSIQNFITSIPDSQPILNFTDADAVMGALKGIVEIIPQGVNVVDEGQLREYLIDQLVYDATFNPDKQVVDLCRKLIKDIATAEGMKLDSVYEDYVQKAHDPRHWSVPAYNIRGIAYNSARSVFESAIANNVALPFILEIARSEIGYTAQRPAEFATSMLAAAIKEGYKGPVYLQGDHFQVALKEYLKDPAEAIAAIKKLIREAIEAGVYQIDLDMSPLVDYTKPTIPEQQENNYKLTAELTAYVRALEKELGLDKLGIVVNLGGEIGEIGKGLDKDKQQNSTVAELRAFMSGYLAELKRLGKEVGYELKPITKVAVQTGTKHGGIRDAEGKPLKKVKVGFNTLGELGKVAREEYGLAGVVQHGASTLPPPYFKIFAGNPVPEGTQIDEALLNAKGIADLSEHPVAEVHLATEYQDTVLDDASFPPGLFRQIKDYVFSLATTQAQSKKDGPDIAFAENRKNAWGPFKTQAWNLPAPIQDTLRASLKPKFDTVFNNMGIKDSRTMLAERRDGPGAATLPSGEFNKMMWGEKLAVFADAFPEVNQALSAKVMEINSAKEGKAYPVLINLEALLKASPDGVMALQNIAGQVGKGNIKLVPHIARDDIKAEEVDKITDETLAAINKIYGYTKISRDMLAAVVVGTNPEDVAKQVQEKTGSGIYMVIGPESYALQFKGVIRVILDQAGKGQLTSVAKALKLGLELIPADGKATNDDLKKIDALFSVDGEGNFHVASSDVTASVSNAAEDYARQLEATDIRV